MKRQESSSLSDIRCSLSVVRETMDDIRCSRNDERETILIFKVAYHK
jgi:hypothetical protein